MRSPLEKAFDPAQHPRASNGEFTAAGTGAAARPSGDQGGPSLRWAGLRELSPAPIRRSMTRGEAWQRIGANLPGLPVAYTGSREKEKSIGSFVERKIIEQIPRGMAMEDHQKLFSRLKAMVRVDRHAAITRALEMFKAPPTIAQQRDKSLSQPKYRVRTLAGPREAPLVPKDTPRGLLNQAYNHAALAALHDHGILDSASFRMDDTLKADLAPLRPFMTFVRRRLLQSFHRDEKGSWQPYRAEFGITFADQRRNPITGDIRRRTRPLQELVKTLAGLPMAKRHEAEIAAEHKRACRIIARCEGQVEAKRGALHPYTARTMPLAQLVLETIGTGGTL